MLGARLGTRWDTGVGPRHADLGRTDKKEDTCFWYGSWRKVATLTQRGSTSPSFKPEKDVVRLEDMAPAWGEDCVYRSGQKKKRAFQHYGGEKTVHAPCTSHPSVLIPEQGRLSSGEEEPSTVCVQDWEKTTERLRSGT